MYSSPCGFFCSGNHPNTLKTLITMSLQHPCKLMAPNAFIPHPLPRGTLPFWGLPISPGHSIALGASHSRASPVGMQHPLAQHQHASCLQLSFILSSPTYLFVLTLAESSSNPGCYCSLGLSGFHTWSGGLKKLCLTFAKLPTDCGWPV